MTNARAADGSRPRGRGDREFIYLSAARGCRSSVRRVTRARAATSTGAKTEYIAVGGSTKGSAAGNRLRTPSGYRVIPGIVR